MTHYAASAFMKLTWWTNAVGVLLLLTPSLGGQNPDELLEVRLPAKQGHINYPGTAPVPPATGRGEIAVRNMAPAYSIVAGCSSVWRGDVCPSKAAGKGKVGPQVVPSGTSKRPQDFLPHQNSRQLVPQ